MSVSVIFGLTFATVIIGSAFYGYKRGFFSLLAKPLRFFIRITLSYYLADSFDSLLYSRLDGFLSDYLPSAVLSFATESLSFCISFLLIYLIMGVILSSLFATVDSLVNSGFFGKINQILGLISFCALTILLVVGAIFLYSELISPQIIQYFKPSTV